MEFDWDEEKAKANATKHKVTFLEATTVFENDLAIVFPDEEHSIDEDRHIIIGHSLKNRLLTVSFVEREDRIRIISARFATAWERKDYEENGLLQ